MQNGAMITASAWELRKLAECAHGHRDRVLDLVYRNGTVELVSRATDSDYLMCRVMTGPSRQREAQPASTLQSVVVTGPTGVPEEVVQKYDAIFWTESSIEKFFFPYYAGVLGPDDFSTLWGSFYTPREGQERIVAFGHIPGTRWVGLGEGGAELTAATAQVLGTQRESRLLPDIDVLTLGGDDDSVSTRPLHSWINYVRALPE
jgi:hypothetical protein